MIHPLDAALLRTFGAPPPPRPDCLILYIHDRTCANEGADCECMPAVVVVNCLGELVAQQSFKSQMERANTDH